MKTDVRGFKAVSLAPKLHSGCWPTNASGFSESLFFVSIFGRSAQLKVGARDSRVQGKSILGGLNGNAVVTVTPSIRDCQIWPLAMFEVEKGATLLLCQLLLDLGLIKQN